MGVALWLYLTLPQPCQPVDCCGGGGRKEEAHIPVGAQSYKSAEYMCVVETGKGG
jgi:hypothetical protein